MKYVIKNTTKSVKTATYKNKAGKIERVVLKPGRNLLSVGDWERIKNTPFILNKLKRDQLTFSEMPDAEDVYVDKISLEKAAEFLGKEDGKDLLAEYAEKFGYKLKKNMNIDNMLKDLKEQVEGAE